MVSLQATELFVAADGTLKRYAAPPVGTPVAPRHRVARLRGASRYGTVTPPPTTDSFILGTTQPFVVDSEASGRSAADNVGAALAFNPPLTLSPLTGTVTINAGQTVRDLILNARVVINSGGRLINCVVSPPSISGSTAAVTVNGGGFVQFCTISPQVSAQNYSINAFTITGTGVTYIDRCDWWHIVDGVHVSGGDHVEVTGCYAHHYSLFTNDPTHSTDASHPYWGHGDVLIQRLSPGTGTDLIRGNNTQAFFDTEGVVWSGGAPGVGTASGGKWGFGIADALNQGYVNTNPASPNYGLGTYANSASWTNASGMKAEIADGWSNGASATSSQIQFTTPPNTVSFHGNRFGLGGKPTSAGRYYLFTASGSTISTAGNPNVFFAAGDRYAADVPTALRGAPIPAASSTQYAITSP